MSGPRVRVEFLIVDGMSNEKKESKDEEGNQGGGFFRGPRFRCLLRVGACAEARGTTGGATRSTTRRAAAGGGRPEAELAKAKALQQQADKYGLGDYAHHDYAAAGKDLAAGQDRTARTIRHPRQSLNKAIDEYTTVISKGGALYLAAAGADGGGAKGGRRPEGSRRGKG